MRSNYLYYQPLDFFLLINNANNQQRGEHLKWDAVTEAGGAVASDEARLALNVLLVKQQEIFSFFVTI